MKKIKFQVWIVLILVLATISALTSCSEESSINNQWSKYNLGDYQLDIIDCYIKQGYTSDIVLIKCIFTNHSDQNQSFEDALEFTVFQNGMELKRHYGGGMYHPGSYNNNVTTNIKPGVTVEVTIAYELTDTVTAIEVEVCERLGGSKKLTKVLQIEE